MSDRDNSRRILFLESLAAAPQNQAQGQPPDRAPDQESPPPSANQQRNPERPNGLPQKRRKLGIALQGKAVANALRSPRPVDQARPDRQAVVPIRQVPELGHIGEFPSHHELRRRRSHAGIISFAICVVLPVVMASIYFSFIASNQYVSEFRFAVTDSSSPTAASATSGLSSLLSGITAPNSSQNYLVTDYLTSREVVDELQSKINIIGLYSRPTADWWSRFNSSQPIEKFLPYWQHMVTASYDPVTGLASAQIKAFTPQDAHLIASQLVKLAEKLVNEIATRPQKDAVRYSENEVRRAEDRLKTIRGELTKYRNTESVIDPNSSVVTSNVTLAQSLRASLAQLQTDLATLTQQQINQNAPTIQVLQSRITATKTQLAAVESQISKSTDGSRPLSNIVGQYEQLDLERQFAQNMVTSTMQTLEQSRANAAAQHLYITPYVRPAIPESSTYPRRISSVLMFAFYCLLVWIAGILLFRSIREHV